MREYRDVLPWLDAQERFDRIRARWRGAPVSDLAYPNPMDVVGAPVVALRNVAGAEPPPYLQYTPYGGVTVARRLVAERLRGSHELDFDWRDVILTPGAMAALSITFRMFAGEGAEVVFPVPCWLDYPAYASHLGLRPILVPLREGDFRLDVDRIADALTPATRAVVLSQPANPTTVVYSERELSDLAAAIRARCPEAWIVSDECHRDWVFPPTKLAAAATFHERTLVTYSFGKAFLMQGQRIGFVAISPRVAESERREVSAFLTRACRFMAFCTPTALMQAVVQKLADFRPDTSILARRHAHARRELTDAGYEVVEGSGTFFMYVRAPQDAFTFVEMLARQGVFVLPSEIFHHQGYFRLSLTADDAEIDRGLAVLRKVRQQAAG